MFQIKYDTQNKTETTRKMDSSNICQEESERVCKMMTQVEFYIKGINRPVKLVFSNIPRIKKRPIKLMHQVKFVARVKNRFKKIKQNQKHRCFK